MKNNIYLIIGENTSGKTRYLQKLNKENSDNGIYTVTNLSKQYYDIDDSKIRSLENIEIQRFEQLKHHSTSVDYDGYVKSLFDLICSQGEVLILDELDSKLYVNDITSLSAAISETRDNWKEIFITGYSPYLCRLFKNEELDEYKDNFYIVNKDLELERITEEQADEYFDKI